MSKDPYSFPFGALAPGGNAVRKPAKAKGSGGKPRRGGKGRTKFGRPKGGGSFGS